MIRLAIVLVLLLTLRITAQTTAPSTNAAVAQSATRPAVLNLIVPDEAKVTVDDQTITQKSITFDQIKPGETKRITVKATFPGGVEERTVDLEEGQTIPLSIAPPQPDKAVAVALQGVDPILALALSPDGRYLVVGLDSSAIVAWDLISGRPVRTFQKHRASVQTLAFSADGKQLLSGSGDNTAMLWDFASGEVIQTYKGHTDQVMCVAFSPDGQRVLTGSMDKTAIIWNTRTGEKLTTIVGHTDQIFGVCYSPDGKTVGTAALDRTGALWDADTGKLKIVLRGHPDCVSSITFSPDGKTVCTGSFDNSAFFWDPTTGKKLRATGKHEIDVYGVTYTPDGTKLITAARDECAIMWDAATGRKIRAFLGHNSDVGGAVVSRDSRLLFTCSRDGMVKLWDMATGMELASLVSDASRQSWAVVAPDGLFDASEPGRRMMGFRFTTIAGGSLDQFFSERYRAGLLPEIYAGNRPFAAKPLGHTLPPTAKIISPKNRSAATTQRATITVEATETAHGGISALHLYNNGTPVAVQSQLPQSTDGQPITVEFKDVSLAPGANQFKVLADNRDASWQGSSAEIEVNYAKSQRSRGRLYVLAIAIGNYPGKVATANGAAKDAATFSELLRTRASKLFDRIDIIPIQDHDATAAGIEDALNDVAVLTQPQDSIILLLSGLGNLTTEKLQFHPYNSANPREEMPIERLAAILGKSAALKRAMIIDLIDAQSTNTSIPANAFAISSAIEHLSRAAGIYAIARLTPTAVQESLTAEMLSAPAKPLRTTDPSGAIELMEWFRTAADQSGATASTQAKAFPIFAGEKP